MHIRGSYPGGYLRGSKVSKYAGVRSRYVVIYLVRTTIDKVPYRGYGNKSRRSHPNKTFHLILIINYTTIIGLIGFKLSQFLEYLVK